MNAQFLIASAVAANAGSYCVEVTNAFGSVTSLVATLAVRSPPTITQHPVTLVLNPGVQAGNSA